MQRLQTSGFCKQESSSLPSLPGSETVQNENPHFWTSAWGRQTRSSPAETRNRFPKFTGFLELCTYQLHRLIFPFCLPRPMLSFPLLQPSQCCSARVWTPEEPHHLPSLLQASCAGNSRDWRETEVLQLQAWSCNASWTSASSESRGHSILACGKGMNH